MKYAEVKNDMIMALDGYDLEPTILGMVLNKLFNMPGVYEVETIKDLAEKRSKKSLDEVVRYTKELQLSYAEKYALRYAVNQTIIDLIEDVTE